MRWALDSMDIGEKGIEERFPNRKKQPRSKTKQAEQAKKSRRLAAARTAHGTEQPNPWKKRARGAEVEEQPRVRRKRRKKTMA
jgi:pantothenate kinase